jgi:hypothetical protein
MKNLMLVLVTMITFGLTNNGIAQSMQSTANYSATVSDNGEVEILKEFKATKQQKKVIKKMKNYVTPRLLSDNPYAATLEGKKAHVQVNFDENGAVSAVTVIECDIKGLDAKFENLIKEFDSKNPIAKSEMERTEAIQLEIPLVSKKYYTIR